MKKPPLPPPNENVRVTHSDAYSDHHHPKVHLTPPAFWMNDPNGLIFWNNEFHLFYQHNPFEAKWGHLHWGHAKSKDLITWIHEPIALAPSGEKKELHCFSGCCVDYNGIPTIVYTSVASLPRVILGPEQWIATSDSAMQTWIKSELNPVMTPKIHGHKKVFNWRDPYVWKYNDYWLAVLGGQQFFPKRGFIGLYKSLDLIHWDFMGSLIPKNSTPRSDFSSIWECPIFFPLPHPSGEKWVLILSPMDKVRYCIGDFDGRNFIPGEWQILDGGRCFYAPNVMQVPSGRKLLWGWLKGGGAGKWNGCFTLPRVLSLTAESKLRLLQTPAPEIEQLRKSQLIHESFKVTSKESVILPEIDLTRYAAIEIQFDINPKSSTLVPFKLQFHDINGGDLKLSPILEVTDVGILRCGKEMYDIHENIKANENWHVRIFVDRAFCEVYINE